MYPPQARDSTVHVRVLVQEAKKRSFQAKTGYARDEGINLEGEITHRSFLGEARNLTLSGQWTTGFISRRTDDLDPGEKWRIALSLRQPYLGGTRLTGILTTFIDHQDVPAVQEEEIGVTGTLIYELLPFRNLTLQHTFSRAKPGNRIGSPKARYLYRVPLEGPTIT